MSQHADETFDHDPLLEFANEQEPAPAPEVDEPVTLQAAADVEVAPAPVLPAAPAAPLDAVNARLDRLEQSIESSAAQFAGMQAELTTLVGVVEDFRKRDIRRAAANARPAPSPRAETRHWPGLTFAALGLIAGMAIGIAGWMLWSRDSSAIVQAMQPPVDAEAPIEPAAPPQAMVVLASTDPAPAAASAVRAHAVDDVREQTEDDVRPAATRYVGTLSIDSEPAGQVFINRQPAGRTPLRIASLKAGSHLVWIERDGYQRWTRVVQVPSDRVSRVSAQLEPLAAR